MKNIAHRKTTNNTKRINRITTMFKRSRKRTKVQMLDRLKYEATFFGQDKAIQSWLIQFEQTLRAIGGK